MDPPRRPRRGVRPRPQPRAAGPDRRHRRHPGGDERRHPRRRVAGGGDGHGLPPGQHRHRRARAARVVRRGDRGRTATGSRSASTYAAARWPPAAGPARAATSTTCWPGSTAEGCARYVVTDVNKDGMLQGPNLQLLRDVCAATDRPVVASGGVTTLDDLPRSWGWSPGRRGRHRRHRALRGPVHPRGRARPHDRGDVMTPRRTRHPVPRRRRRPGGQGHQLPGAARRRRPGRAGPHVRRRGRRRADLPRHLRLARGPRDHHGDRVAHGRGGLHPADRRRGSRLRSTTSTGCCGPGPTRSRSTPPRSTGPSWWPRSRTGSATRCWSSRSTPAARRTPTRASRSPPTAAASRPGSTPSRGPPAPPSSAPARSCSTRWTPTAPRTASTSS